MIIAKRKNQLQNNVIYVTIDEKMYNKIKNYNTEIKPLSEINIYLRKRILESKNRAHLSCRKLANEFTQMTGKKVGKTIVNNILKKELGFRFLKTTLKNNNIKMESGI